MNSNLEIKSKKNTSALINGKAISFTPKRIGRFLTYIILFLLGAYIVSGFLNKTLGVENFITKGLYYIFDLDGENNIPSTFSFLILLLSFILLAFVCFTTDKKKDKKFWLMLSLIFLFLACDESMQIHEHLSRFLKKNYVANVAGSDFVWVLPYGIFSLVIGILFLKFVLQLPRVTRNLFLTAGFMYVGCALGIDYVQGIIQHYIETENLSKIYYKIFTIIEEPGEMFGIIIFIYALLTYLTTENGNVVFTLISEHKSDSTNRQ